VICAPCWLFQRELLRSFPVLVILHRLFRRSEHPLAVLFGALAVSHFESQRSHVTVGCQDESRLSFRLPVSPFSAATMAALSSDDATRFVLAGFRVFCGGGRGRNPPRQTFAAVVIGRVSGRRGGAG
jgi:hypothetical protein